MNCFIFITQKCTKKLLTVSDSIALETSIERKLPMSQNYKNGIAQFKKEFVKNSE